MTETRRNNETLAELQQLMQQVCKKEPGDEDESPEELKEDDDVTSWQFNSLEEFVSKAQGILKVKKEESVSDSDIKAVKDSFDLFEGNLKKAEEQEQFQFIESFILREATIGGEKRLDEKKLADSEEKRLAAEIAQLKGARMKYLDNSGMQELPQKIMDTERAFINRKMVVAKASQVASAECRVQFARVRKFFESLHHKHLKQLRDEFQRNLKIKAIVHRLKGTDSRVVSLERQVENRLYQAKKANANEYHMAQNLQEGLYLEPMLSLLDEVQSSKETAAKELYELHIKDLKARQIKKSAREEELALLKASATLEMSKLIEGYGDETFADEEAVLRKEEAVAAAERLKDFNDSPHKAILSVSQLYDTVLWSAASMTAFQSGSSDFSSDYDSDDDDDFDTEQFDPSESEDAGLPRTGDVSPPASIHLKQLKKDLYKKEKALLKKHADEDKRKRRKHRATVRALKNNHQVITEQLLEKLRAERINQREGIVLRMDALAKHQRASLGRMHVAIETDRKVMQDALKAESKRLVEAETSSFVKAQTLVSAQVYHEVRNALSAVIAMSETASTLKNDEMISPTELVSSVNEMLAQSEEVVTYALNMLNNVLDMSKIQDGSFKPDVHLFDLQELVGGATKMQLAKAEHIKMSFVPVPQSCIAESDRNVLIRIMTNLISNALKFTSAGAVQPFVWPISVQSGHADSVSEDMKMVAVGVADTGPGLSPEALRFAEKGKVISKTGTVKHGAKNSGYGLHLAHTLAKAIGSNLEVSGLEKWRHLLDANMVNALLEHETKLDEARTVAARTSALYPQGTLLEGEARGSSTFAPDIVVPGPGTVIFLTLPVKSGEQAKAMLQDSKILSSGEMMLSEEDRPQYKFLPRPVSTSERGFRVLVADDVELLRKGMSNTLCSLFANRGCPVSISTACTAEDALRAVASNPFDLVVMDNIFNHDHSKYNLLSHREEANQGRPCIFCRPDTPPKEWREDSRKYFKAERFTCQKGDGELLGIDALLQLAERRDLLYPTPVLMLLSGNKVEISPEYGIIVAQKPLKQSEFVPLLEANVPHLLERGVCSEVESSSLASGGSYPATVRNRSGSQLFVQQHDEIG